MSKHTPQPFEVFQGDGISIRTVDFGVIGRTDIGPSRIATFHNTGFPGEAQANARLFKAAPGLLDACYFAIGCIKTLMDGQGWAQEAYDHIIAAVKEAKDGD
jgi:hypothetical protein